MNKDITINLVSNSSFQKSEQKQNINASTQNSEPIKQVQIERSENEGECPLQDLLLLKLNYFKLTGTIFLIILSCGCFGFALIWVKKLQRKFFYSFVQDISNASHLLIINHNQKWSFVNIKTLSSTNEQYFSQTFKCQLVKYIFDPYKNSFKITETNLQNMDHSQIIQLPDLKENEIFPLREKFGQCECRTPKPNIWKYLAKELTSPQYAIQYFTFIVFFIQGIVQFAVLIIGMSLTFTFLNYFVFIKRAYNKLLQSLITKQTVQLKRQGQFIEIDSKDIVPGDKLILKENMKAPCDIVLLEGELFVNEANLTGESLPIPKFSLQTSENKLDFNEDRANILYEGTTILTTKAQCIGIVARTGFITQKGQIFRSVLFPEDPEFSFYKYLSYFYFIWLTIGFMIFPYYAINQMDQKQPTSIIVMSALQLIVTIIPPNMPITVGIALSGGVKRLKNKKVTCQIPDKIFPPSSVTTVCFDKTGTLTQDKIILQEIYDRFMRSVVNKDNQQINYLLASCHMVQLVDEKLTGDSLELAMMDCIGASMKDNQTCEYQGQEIKILKIFQFESQFARMSVIVEINNEYFLFLKGAPEIIQQISTEESKPEQLQQRLEKMLFEGLRVLGIGMKKLDNFKETYPNIQNISREEMESDVEFMGLIGFENPLKSDSSKVLKELDESGYGIKVISGDNQLTVVNCAIEANIINKNHQLVVLDQQDNQLVGSILDLEEKIIINNDFQIKDHTNYLQFAVTGKFLQKFMEKSLEISEHELEIIKDILQQKTQIFARQKPDQKAQIIQFLQQNNKKIGMVGDGANDCAAIKQSDMGITFSNTDASYSSPFSYQDTSLEVVQIILKESKCSMTNMVDLFKINFLSAFCRYYLSNFLITQATTTAQLQAIFYYLFVQLPFQFFVAAHGPTQRKLKNLKVQDKFTSKEILFSTTSQVIISVFTIYIGQLLLKQQSFFQPTSWRDVDQEYNKSKGQNKYLIFESEYATTVCLLQFVSVFNSVISVVHQEPLKKMIHKFKPMLIYIIICVSYYFLLILFPEIQIPGFYLVEMDWQFRGIMFAIAVTSGIITYFTEHFLKSKLGILRREKIWDQNQKEYQEQLSSQSSDNLFSIPIIN